MSIAKHKISKETLEEIKVVTEALCSKKDELQRYNDEDYLHDTVGKQPWVTITIANHPTYLSDFVVDIFDPKTRKQIVGIALKQLKIQISDLEKELDTLLNKKRKPPRQLSGD